MPSTQATVAAVAATLASNVGGSGSSSVGIGRLTGCSSNAPAATRRSQPAARQAPEESSRENEPDSRQQSATENASNSIRQISSNKSMATTTHRLAGDETDAEGAASTSRQQQPRDQLVQTRSGEAIAAAASSESKKRAQDPSHSQQQQTTRPQTQTQPQRPSNLRQPQPESSNNNGNPNGSSSQQKAGQQASFGNSKQTPQSRANNPQDRSLGAAAGSSGAAAGSAKIDGDLVNVANENRVILNVGGIRHETYKVSLYSSISFVCFLASSKSSALSPLLRVLSIVIQLISSFTCPFT